MKKKNQDCSKVCKRGIRRRLSGVVKARKMVMKASKQPRTVVSVRVCSSTIGIEVKRTILKCLGASQ